MSNYTFKNHKSIENGLMVGSHGLPSRIIKKDRYGNSYKETRCLKAELTQLSNICSRNWKSLAITFTIILLYLTSYCLLRSNYNLNKDENGFHLTNSSGDRIENIFILILYPLFIIEGPFLPEHDNQCESC